jgi:hypothetical protein
VNGDLCHGLEYRCNIEIAMRPEERGEQLHHTASCVLGWLAKGSHRPDSRLWKTLGASADFQRNILTEYHVKEVQVLAQLAVPAVITPQFGGAVAFSKRFHRVANSIDHDSSYQPRGRGSRPSIW